MLSCSRVAALVFRAAKPGALSTRNLESEDDINGVTVFTMPSLRSVSFSLSMKAVEMNPEKLSVATTPILLHSFIMSTENDIPGGSGTTLGL